MSKQYPVSHDPQQTYGLGPVEAEGTPSSSGMPKAAAENPCPFKLLRRMPYWYPDAVDSPEPIPEPSGSAYVVQYLFQEEALQLHKSANILLPFPVPQSKNAFGQNVPFKEPTNPAEWATFNSWMYGTGIPSPTETEPLLTTIVRDLADLARLYNSQLYRLRRLHFYYKMCMEHETQEWPLNLLPPYNKYQGTGSADALPPCDDTPGSAFCVEVEASENAWQSAAAKINNYIQKYDGMLAADMVKVNGYIVSVRAVYCPALDQPYGSGLMEVGGSSSHVSVSSAFSSPSSSASSTGSMQSGVRKRGKRKVKAKRRR